MIIEKNQYGAYVISDIVKGYWIYKQYYFYTKKEAIKLFRKFRKEKKMKQSVRITKFIDAF